MKPLMVDLFAGLGGWAEGGLAEDYFVIGFDIERHEYGEHRYPAQLVLQDVLTLHGRQLKDAALIVARPPCQEYSYMAMPWSRAKDKALWYRDHAKADDPEGPRAAERQRELTALFDACFRIQREAIEAASHFIPLVVENVRGAIPWVGRSRWNYGSFHLWGDVPALMPMTKSYSARGERGGSGKSFQTASVDGLKTVGHINKRDGHSHTRHLTNQAESDGVKCGGDWFNAEQPSISRMTSSKSNARKAASAAIAKIPLPLAQYIARVYKPNGYDDEKGCHK